MSVPQHIAKNSTFLSSRSRSDVPTNVCRGKRIRKTRFIYIAAAAKCLACLIICLVECQERELTSKTPPTLPQTVPEYLYNTSDSTRLQCLVFGFFFIYLHRRHLLSMLFFGWKAMLEKHVQVNIENSLFFSRALILFIFAEISHGREVKEGLFFWAVLFRWCFCWADKDKKSWRQERAMRENLSSNVMCLGSWWMLGLWWEQEKEDYIEIYKQKSWILAEEWIMG